MTGNDHDALDATQDALIAITRGLDRYDGRAAFTTWAYRVTTNACLDELRRRKRRPVPASNDRDGVDSPGPGAGPSGAPHLDQTVADRLAIDGALQQLPPEFRAPVVLRDVLGLDYAEIADVLAIPAGHGALAHRPRPPRPGRPHGGRKRRREPDRPRSRRTERTMTEPTPPPHEPDPVEPVDDRSDGAPGPGAASPADSGAGDIGWPTGVVDATAPVDALDDAASAVLDGLPVGDPSVFDPAQLDERVQELAAVTERLAEPLPAPEPSIVDAHIAAALEALPAATEATAAMAATDGAPAEIDRSIGPAVASLADRRRRPAIGRWVAVAAAIAVIALAIPVLRSLSDSSSSSNDTAASVTASGDAGNAEGGSADRSAVAPTNGAAASTTAQSAQLDSPVASSSGGDLGAADSEQVLTALVEQAAPDATGHPTTQSSASVDSTTTAAPFARAAGPHCDATTRASFPELGALRYSATATYQSTPVEVSVYEVPSPTAVTYRLIAVAVDDCRVLVDRTYP